MSRKLWEYDFRNTLCLAASALFVSLSAPASAAQGGFRIPAMDVVIDADARDCQITAAASEAAVKSAMRYNRMESTDEVGAPYVYLTINGLELVQGGNRCAIAVDLSFRGLELQPSKLLGTLHLGRVVYCERGAIISWDKPTAQAQINSYFKNWVDECVLEIEESYASNKRSFQ